MKNVLMILGIVVFMAVPASAATWNVPGDFPDITAAIAGVPVGSTILVGPGNHAGALVDKEVEIKGEGGAVITSGPAHGSGLIQGFRMLAGSDGATISHLDFDGVDLAIMNGAAVGDVTVDHCTFKNTVQAISNWGGSGWQISHNVVNDLRTRNGGGIGILTADWVGIEVKNNVISHNKITGTLHVYASDGGGYSGTGIVLYADFRWGRDGTVAMSDNRIVKNTVTLISDTPSVVDVWAFELTQAWGTAGPPDPEPIVIFDNAIGFNDWRGTAQQMLISPSDLDNPTNKISRNLGENRGHGQHPSVFGAGGNP